MSFPLPSFPHEKNERWFELHRPSPTHFCRSERKRKVASGCFVVVQSLLFIFQTARRRATNRTSFQLYSGRISDPSSSRCRANLFALPLLRHRCPAIIARRRPSDGVHTISPFTFPLLIGRQQGRCSPPLMTLTSHQISRDGIATDPVVPSAAASASKSLLLTGLFSRVVSGTRHHPQRHLVHHDHVQFEIPLPFAQQILRRKGDGGGVSTAVGTCTSWYLTSVERDGSGDVSKCYLDCPRIFQSVSRRRRVLHRCCRPWRRWR